MRNMIKLVDIITLAVVIGFMAGCENPTGSTHAHQWGNWRQTRAPTCTTAGEETRTCTLDATHVEIQAIPIDPNAHNYGNWAETTAPSCTTSGEESGTCAYNNSHTTTRAIAALGHDYQSWAQTTAPTCTTDGEETGTCTRDAATTIRPVAALGHDYGNWTQITAPTCTTAGEESGTCTRDAVTTTRSVAALGHNYGNWTQTTAPTETNDGVETRTCSRNASHVETRTAYATGTAGLAFELINDSTAYRIRAGAVTSGEVHIPAYHLYNGNYLSVTEIGVADNYSDQAFGGTNITAVHIPETVTSIGGFAFYATKLTSITIPTGVTTIGISAFQNWTSSQTIYIDSYASQSAADAAWRDEWGNYWRSSCNAVIKYKQSNGTYQ